MTAEDAATVIVSHRVAPEKVDAFRAWHERISAAESSREGFVEHRLEEPIPGVQDEWLSVLSFRTTAQLDAWLTSPERAAIVADADVSDVRLTRISRGFGFWSRDDAPDPIFKSNLLVLLVLYPLVFLWGYFVSEPLIDSHGVPFWLSLFIGNIVSTQLLGWFVAPWIFRRFRWWLRRKPGWPVHLLGYGILVVLYGISLAAFAWLAAIRG